MTLKIEITIEPPPKKKWCPCVKTPTRVNLPAYGETCKVCGISNPHKPRPPECKPGCRGECQGKADAPPENLGVKVHMFKMVARAYHRASGHLPRFDFCMYGDCPLWRAAAKNTKPLKQ